MLRVSTLLSLPLVIAALVVAGCQKPAEKTAPKENAAHNHGPAAAKAGSPHPNPLPKGEGTQANALSKREGTAELTADDRAAIKKQKTCPVTGQPLGSMGDPVKVVVKGQTVFLCCAACEDAIKKDPDKYLAKLKTGGKK